MSNRPPKYQHVIWDWNGTLIDDMPLALSIVNDMLARRNMKTITEQQYVTLFEHPVTEFYKAIGFNLDVVPFEQVTKEFGSAYASGCGACKLQRGAVDALNTLNSRGLSQSILSASHRESLEQNVRRHGVQGYFMELVGLDNYNAHSKIEQGLSFLKRLPYNPQEVVLIGDTTHDYAVAQELGCACLLVSHGHQSASRLATTGAAVFESLESLLEGLCLP